MCLGTLTNSYKMCLGTLNGYEMCLATLTNGYKVCLVPEQTVKKRVWIP